MRRRWRAALVATALLLSACGGDGDEVTGERVAPPGVDGTVDCSGTVFDPETLDEAPDVSVLPAGPAGATDDIGAPAFEAGEGWRVVLLTEERVDLVRELPEPQDLGQGDVRTHEVRRLERITGASNVPEGAWLLTLSGPCAARVVTEASDDVGDADLTLPAEPDPTSTTLDLLVWERACASGQSAEGRVVVLGFEETEEEIRVHLGVRPVQGDAACPSNPPTPFSLPLSRPLGDRQVVDVSVSPPRVVLVDDGRSDLDPDGGALDEEALEALLSWEPPGSYELLLETVCMPCQDNIKRVRVEDDEVVERVAVDEDGGVIREATPDEAPSLTELIELLRRLWAESPNGVLVVEADPDGTPVFVDLDPDPTDDAGRIGFLVLELTPR